VGPEVKNGAPPPHGSALRRTAYLDPRAEGEKGGGEELTIIGGSSYLLLTGPRDSITLPLRAVHQREVIQSGDPGR